MSDDDTRIFFSSELSDRERASFEAGIKLGALYHILCGIPISSKESVIQSVEQGIEAAISCQPHVKSVKINLSREKISGDKTNEYDYDEITGKIITAELTLEYENVQILAKIDWVNEMEYPLMYIKEISEKH